MPVSRFVLLLKKEEGFERVTDTICRLFEGEGWSVNRTYRTDYVLIRPKTLYKDRREVVAAFRKFITKELYLDRLVLTDSLDTVTR